MHKRLGLTRTPLGAGLVFCLVLGVAGRVNAASPSTRQSPVSSAVFNSNFAIADFDGDRKPDLATVEVQKGNSSSTSQYSIRLQLTAGGVLSMALEAGLKINDFDGEREPDELEDLADEPPRPQPDGEPEHGLRRLQHDLAIELLRPGHASTIG